MTDEIDKKPELEPHRVLVRNDTAPKGLGWALFKFYTEGKLPFMVGVGVAAIGSAMKGVAVANGHLAPMGIIFDVFPKFSDAEDEHAGGGDLRALTLDLRVRKL